MKAYLVAAVEKSFTNDKKELVKGLDLLFITESDDFKRYFVSDDRLKGYEPEMLAKINGKLLNVSSEVKTYNGKMKEVLTSIDYAK